jgi:hypothetical protein
MRRGARGLIVPAASQIGSRDEPDLLPSTAGASGQRVTAVFRDGPVEAEREKPDARGAAGARPSACRNARESCPRLPARSLGAMRLRGRSVPLGDRLRDRRVHLRLRAVKRSEVRPRHDNQ